MTRQNLSARALSRATGLHHDYIGSLIRQQTPRNPSIGTLLRLADALGIPLERLCVRDGKGKYLFTDLQETYE